MMALLASPSAAGKKAPTEAAETAEPALMVALELADGSRVIGAPELKSVRVQTPYASMDIPLDQIRTLTLHDDPERASLEMRNGDSLEGVVDLKTIKLSTVFGPVTVASEHVMSVRAWSNIPGREGLVLHYSFDSDRDDTITDSSDAANHGRLVGPKWIVDGRFGGAYRFDGRDDYIDCGDDASLQITGELTYSVWFRASSNHTGNLVSRRARGDTANDIASHLTLRDTGGMTAGIVGPVFAPGKGAHYPLGVPLSDGGWHHAAMVYRPDTSLALYIDGALAEVITDGIFPSLNPKPLPVRVGVADSKFYFNGDIDEVMIFDRALSEAELQQLYSAQP